MGYNLASRGRAGVLALSPSVELCLKLPVLRFSNSHRFKPMQTCTMDSSFSAFFCRPIGLAALTLLACLASANVKGARPETPSAPIPLSEIGAKAIADYHGDALAVTETAEGARLLCGFQKLEGHTRGPLAGIHRAGRGQVLAGGHGRRA